VERRLHRHRIRDSTLTEAAGAESVQLIEEPTMTIAVTVDIPGGTEQQYEQQYEHVADAGIPGQRLANAVKGAC
jgi:hypothetical protein